MTGGSCNQHGVNIKKGEVPNERELRLTLNHPLEQVGCDALHARIIFGEIPAWRFHFTRRRGEDHVPPTGAGIENDVSFRQFVNARGMDAASVEVAIVARARRGSGEDRQARLVSVWRAVIFPADEFWN